MTKARGELTFGAVKLRDHPSMVRKSGVVSWPPQWQPLGRNGGFAESELGVLEDVSMNDMIANKIFLAMEHLAQRYIAVLAFDDEMFAKALYSIFLENIGRTIQEIGELDLSHLH